MTVRIDIAVGRTTEQKFPLLYSGSNDLPSLSGKLQAANPCHRPNSSAQFKTAPIECSTLRTVLCSISQRLLCLPPNNCMLSDKAWKAFQLLTLESNAQCEHQYTIRKTSDQLEPHGRLKQSNILKLLEVVFPEWL